MNKDKKMMNSDPDGETSNIDERRSFLIGLGKWSKVIVGGALFGGLISAQQNAHAAWVNRRGGGGWVNRRGGSGGGGWVNGRGGGGGGWINRR